MNSDDILRRPLTSELGGILPRKWQPANEVNPRFKMVPWEYCFLLGTGDSVGALPLIDCRLSAGVTDQGGYRADGGTIADPIPRPVRWLAG